jgi:hypothetical protein
MQVFRPAFAPPYDAGPVMASARAARDGRSGHAIWGDAMIDEGYRHGRGPGRSEDRARARLAARHAEHLYPGPLGRLVAHELTACAEGDAGLQPGGLAELVVREVLDHSPARGRLVRPGEIRGRTSRRH